MLYNCYLRHNIVYVPTVGRRGGAYTDIEPVAVVPIANSEALRRAFVGAIARQNVAVPLQKGQWPAPVVLKYAGVKSWGAFARDASAWNIEEHDGQYRIVGNRKHPDGYWVEDPNQKIEFAFGTNADEVIARMIAILQQAAAAGSP